MSSYKSIDSAKYQLLKDAYYATGGFYDGGYLERAPAERETKYKMRKSLSSYANYFQQVVDANVISVFNNVIRNENSKFNEAFIDDVDGNGTDAGTFWRNTGIEAESNGFVIAFLDSDPEQPDNAMDMINGRTYPKIIKITPSQLYEYDMEGEGNITYLSYKSGEINGTPVYTIYDNGYFYKGTINKKGNMEMETEKIEALMSPSVITFEPYPDPWTLPESKYSGISKKVKVIYNLESLIAYQGTGNTFPVLWNPNQPLEDNAKMDEDIIWNSNPKGGEHLTPSYLVPPDTMATIRAQIDSLKQQIYESTNLNVLGTSADASGESRAYSDIIRIEGLQRKAEVMHSIESRFMEEFENLTGQENLYDVVYPSDFATLTLQDQIDQAQGVLDMGVSDENSALVRISVLLKMFPNATDEEKEKIISNEYTNILEPIEGTNVNEDLE